MRVAHIESGKHAYGGAAQVRYLLEGLADAQIDNILICARGGALAACHARLKCCRCRCMAISTSASWTDCGARCASSSPTLSTCIRGAARIFSAAARARYRRSGDRHAARRLAGQRPVDEIEISPVPRRDCDLACDRSAACPIRRRDHERIHRIPSAVDTERYRPDEPRERGCSRVQAAGRCADRRGRCAAHRPQRPRALVRGVAGARACTPHGQIAVLRPRAARARAARAGRARAARTACSSSPVSATICRSFCPASTCSRIPRAARDSASRCSRHSLRLAGRRMRCGRRGRRAPGRRAWSARRGRRRVEIQRGSRGVARRQRGQAPARRSRPTHVQRNFSIARMIAAHLEVYADAAV